MDTRLAPSIGVFALLLLATASGASGEPARPAARTAAADTVRFQTWTYEDAPMGLYLPAGPTKGLPVVMFLHGCHNDPVYEGLWINAALNAIEPTAVFLPTAPETAGENSCADWGGTYDARIRWQLANALDQLDSLIQANQFDSTRQYLYGESMGGEGVYRLLMDFPTRFQGAVTVGGYSVNKGAAQMAQTPLWILIGTDDELSPVADTRTIHQAIVDAGGTQVKLTELPGLGHVPAIEQVRTDTGVVAWLLRQHRSSTSIGARAARSFPARPFTWRDGSLVLSEDFPAGARLRLSGLDGTRVLDLDASTKSVTLPASLRGGVAVWTISHAGRSWSGKVLLER